MKMKGGSSHRMQNTSNDHKNRRNKFKGTVLTKSILFTGVGQMMGFSRTHDTEYIYIYIYI
jgi:hypothetical protein